MDVRRRAGRRSPRPLRAHASRGRCPRRRPGNGHRSHRGAPAARAGRRCCMSDTRARRPRSASSASAGRRPRARAATVSCGPESRSRARPRSPEDRRRPALGRLAVVVDEGDMGGPSRAPADVAQLRDARSRADRDRSQLELRRLRGRRQQRRGARRSKRRRRRSPRARRRRRLAGERAAAGARAARCGLG